MEYPFDVQVLWVLKPGHIPANRARYQIFSGRLELLASAVGIERRGSQPSSAPYSNVLEIVGVEGGPLLRMTRSQREWKTEFRDAEGALVGTIQTGKTWRRYTFLNGAGKTIAKVAGDPGLREFSVSTPNGRKLATIRKTRAGLFKEMSAPYEHYETTFAGPVAHPLRVLIAMMPLVLDHIPPENDPKPRRFGPASQEPARLPVSVYLDDETDSEQVEAAIDMSLRPAKDAALRAGALLIVKVDWAARVHQLTPGQQAILDDRPELLSAPRQIASALHLAAPAEAP